MKRRLIALLLSLTMVIGLLPPALALESGPVALTSDGEAVDEVTVCKYTTGEDQPVTVTAETDDADATFRWQFLMEDLDMWVNIYGEEASDCVLTYAKVCNMLDENEEARMRCVVTLSDGTVYGQDGELDFTVKVDEETLPELPEPEALKPQVLSGFEVLFPEIDIPEIELPEIEIPEIEIPEIEIPEWPDLPELPDMPGFPEFPDYPTDFPEFPLEPSSPAEETPEAPAEETPEAPAEETPEAPVEETPEAPAEETPEAPVEETPEAPAEETPEAPAEETPEAPAEETPEAPTEETPADSADEAPADEAGEADGGEMTAAAIYNAEKTNLNVVINYVFTDGKVAYDSYIASLAVGTSFEQTVKNPKVLGYVATVDESLLPTDGSVTFDAETGVTFNITSITEEMKDITVTVTYQPTDVDYTVRHYLQNLNDDNYTEVVDDRETLQGLTNSTVPDVANTYDGFYALLYEKPAIAADGRTVVEVYYDRYYYLMNFDLDGGYGVEPIYARYGTPISVPTEDEDGNKLPIKAGYTFQGWLLNGKNATIPSTMPAENRTYKADWVVEGTAKVTVVFWGENADDEKYSYIRSMKVDVKPGESYSFDGSSLVCPLAEHSHDNCVLQCTHTSHTIDCYSTNNGFIKTEKPSNSLTNNGNGIYTYTTTGFLGRRTTHYYLNIGDKWYCGTDYWGYKDDERQINFDCKHTHTDECYGCGLIAHTHSSDCSGLWTFVKSDTVTVAADGSSVVNVYYDRVEYSVQFYSRDRGNREYEALKITAKWGASILDKWPTYDGSSSWYVSASGNTWQNSIQVMPVGGAKFYGPKTGDGSYTATYYVEVLPGEEGTLHNGVTYKFHHQDTSVSSGNVTDEERYEIQGFTYKEGTANGNSFDGAAFYYTRNSYTLTFNDGYNVVKTESVLYEAPLSTYSSYVPAVPSAYEPGSVVFGGWYLNPECTGEEYKLDEHTMPADNVLLYAKWAPVSHTVQFYLDKGALDAGTKLSTHPDITVSHGSKADPTPAAPTNGSYTFVGWFYMEDGVEKAFDFANMPVNKDLKVYGKWSSNVLKEYTVYYKIQGTDTQIADPTTGSGLAGATKTFEAKGGTDLYADYQVGYFPVTKSHSLTIDINATEENDTNVYTFWYVQKEAVPYTVKYLNKETGAEVAPAKTVSDNRKAVVTETFVPISGMMPDAYQKRLVVSAEEGAVNEIIFYYTEDTTHAYYKITHYTENLATDAQGKPTWTEYASSQAVGDIGTTYTADSMTIPGFTYDSTVPGTVARGELTSSGLELKLYYKRNSYPYQVRYLEKDSGKQLADPKNDTGKYGQVISESAIDITNYEAVDPTSQTLNIRIEESQTEAKLNIITFYYKEKEAIINYVVVGPTGCGSVTPASETLKVLSGTASGSTATASEGFRFVGWYSDKDCTIKVSGNAAYVPTKADGTPWTAATYYAKFEYDVADLTINKSVGADGQDDTFIFRITGGTGDDAIDMKVTITGSGSVTIKGLRVGTTYTVTEDTNWSWRYRSSCDHTDGKVTITAGGSEITFTNTFENTKWLTDAFIVVNNWEKKKNSPKRRKAQGKED